VKLIVAINFSYLYYSISGDDMIIMRHLYQSQLCVWYWPKVYEYAVVNNK